MGPLSLLTTPLFSFFGKLRLLCEPFVKPLDAEDPSMAEFILHRFGKDVLDYAIDPFMGGIYGGSPKSSRQNTRSRRSGIWRKNTAR